MEAVLDPFQPLLHLIGRYRQDVHNLKPPASAQAFPTAQAHIGELPPGLKDFLRRWNGATLFRGALRVRAISELAPASPEVEEVVLFADGPRESDHWGYAAAGSGHHFGRWTGQKLIPLHEDFHRWLYAQARVLDENRTDEAAQLALRIEVDPDDGLLLMARGDQLMAEGDGDAALKAFQKAVVRSPDLPSAWQRLGEALLTVDRSAAVHALLMALRHTRLPLPYPGAPSADRGLVRLLEGHFPAGDPGWERELSHFLNERCLDLRRDEGGELIESAARAWMRSRLARGDRHGARAMLASVRDRVLAFAHPPSLYSLQLALVSLDTDLGNHDEAEETLRRLRGGPLDIQARCALALARIAQLRDEPWIDELVDEALSGLTDEADRFDAWMIRAERGSSEAVGEVVRLSARLGDKARQARAALVQGDHARNAKNIGVAKVFYGQCQADPESWFRSRLRMGELAGSNREAIDGFQEAIDGFVRLELPLREAWARLRLARMGDASQVEPALRIFRATSLATGVAAVDTICGNPGAHLPWHLNLAAEYARQRHDAQRMRPPFSRADADRPERRLLSHRSAIAACDARIVTVLSENLRSDLATLRRSDGRIQGPPAMRFIAMADLLAGHGSFDAARELMSLLKEDIPNEAVTRSLIGAVARSPNMTLVQTLLEHLKDGNRPEPGALVRIIEVLGWRREAEAAPRLAQLAATASLPVRKAAITALGRIGDASVVDLLLGLVEVPELAEVTSVALLLLGEWQGVDFHGQSLAQRVQGLQRSPGELVGRFGGPTYLLLLLSGVDKEGPSALGAMHGLGLLGAVRAVPKLIELTGDRDANRAKVAGAALELITGNHEDPEAPHPKQRWEGWWEANRDKFSEGVRYREGRPFNVRRMLEKLSHDDPVVRQSTYDELVISTGVRLPFDAEGPWRVQQAHRRGWEKWYHNHAASLPPTGWLFHGRSVA